MLDQNLQKYLEESKNAKDAFPIPLHSQVNREMRMGLLQELASTHRVFENDENGVKYVLDYKIAKKLFSNNPCAIRYTCLITPENDRYVQSIENQLEMFPVFADLDTYKSIRPYAKNVQNAVERRLSTYPLSKVINNIIDDELMTDKFEIDLLDTIKKANARIAIDTLGWKDLIDVETFIGYSNQIFSIFGGEIGRHLGADDINRTYEITEKLKDPKFSINCVGRDMASPDSYSIYSSVFMQWVTGFITPTVSWIGYCFLEMFKNEIGKIHGNLSKGGCPFNRESSNKIINSCLKNYMPFQAIHRLVIEDIEVEGYNFRKGDFVCIVPDALFGNTSEGEVISAVIGAPTRPCMGMHTSTQIAKTFVEIFEKKLNYFNTFNIEYDFVPSLSALVFSGITLIKKSN